MKIDPNLYNQLIESNARILFHGTCHEFTDFTEDSIGKGGDHNSSLGVHLAEFPGPAAEYAEMGLHSDGVDPRDARVLIVALTSNRTFSEHDHDRFFGLSEQEEANASSGKPGFEKWRKELLEEGFDTVDYEDGAGCITVALLPQNLRIIGRITLDQAYELEDALCQEDDTFSNQVRLDLLADLEDSAPTSQPRSPGMR